MTAAPLPRVLGADPRQPITIAILAMGGQGGGVSLWLGKFIVYRVMPFDRLILIVALVCSLGVLGMGTKGTR